MEKQQFKRILLAITYAIGLFFILNHLSLVWNVLSGTLSILMPFILGACLAFILSIPMGFFERTIFRFDGHRKLEKLRRPLSLILTLLIFAGIIVAVIFIVMPELARTFQKIGTSIPSFAQEVYDWVNSWGINWQGVESWLGEAKFDFNSIFEKLATFAQDYLGGAVNSMIGVVSSVAQGIMNVVIGLIFSAYVLFSKEKIIRQCKRLLYAVAKESIVDRAIAITHLSHRTFSKFLTGQCLEALILGMLFYIFMVIFQMPYALLIAVLIAVTALIPIFGAFIGCVVGALLILMVNPMQALWFVVMFLVLQQLEGNFIYPHVVGNSVGLPPLWVLIAVTVGGSLMGVFGMLLFIPIVSVIYTLTGEAIEYRLRRRNVHSAKWQVSDTHSHSAKPPRPTSPKKPPRK